MEATPETDALLARIVDFVLPALPPYELSLYLLLLRRSRVVGIPTVRIGKRTISEALGKGTRASRGNYQHITEKLNILADAGFIQIGITDRQGTLYTVALPEEVPQILARIGAATPSPPDANYYRGPALRVQLFDRDDWRCRYCGGQVTQETATLDHITPISRGGTDDPENLATSCLLCNSIKSGRTYDEAAPAILDALRTKRLG